MPNYQCVCVYNSLVSIIYLSCIWFNRYASIRAIESPSAVDDLQWLTYWIIYSFITLFELSFYGVLVWYEESTSLITHAFNFVYWILSNFKLMDIQASVLAIRQASILHVAGATHVQWRSLYLRNIRTEIRQYWWGCCKLRLSRRSKESAPDAEPWCQKISRQIHWWTRVACCWTSY